MPLLSVGDPAGAAQSHGEDNFRHSALCGKGCKLHSLFLTAFTGRKKGKIELEYYGLDDLNDLIDALRVLEIHKHRT